MLRSQALCACVLLAMAPAVGLASAKAQQDNGHEGPAPIDNSQSISAGANDDIGGISDQGRAPDPEREREHNATTSGHAGGAYGGVVPGASNKVGKPAPAAKGPPTITWPGFQMRPDGSSRVFIQSTKPVQSKVLPTAAGKYELQLAGARIAEKTNRLPLDTRFFNTAVTKVSVAAARSGVVVQLDLRAAVTPQVTSEQGPTGYYFTYIELPKGEYLKGKGTSDNNLPTLQLAPPASKVIGKAAPSTTQARRANGRLEESLRADIKLSH